MSPRLEMLLILLTGIYDSQITDREECPLNAVERYGVTSSYGYGILFDKL